MSKPDQCSKLPNHPNLLPKEIAVFLNISVTQVYRMMQDRTIPHVKVGEHYRIPREKFSEWYTYQLEQSQAEA